MDIVKSVQTGGNSALEKQACYLIKDVLFKVFRIALSVESRSTLRPIKISTTTFTTTRMLIVIDRFQSMDNVMSD